MSGCIVVNPLTRAGGMAELRLEVENQKISAIQISGMQYRGFSFMLQNRPQEELPALVSHVCGSCWVAHSTASAKVAEALWHTIPAPMPALLRELAGALQVVINHVEHFYRDILPDYLHPMTGGLGADGDWRLHSSVERTVWEGSRNAAEVVHNAREALAALTGAATHGRGIGVGGISLPFTKEREYLLRRALNALHHFVAQTMRSDIHALSTAYPDYFNIGGGQKNFLDFGMAGVASVRQEPYKGGVTTEKGVALPDWHNITVNTHNSWICTEREEMPLPYHIREINLSKEGGTSWIPAARYAGVSCETGALARQILRGKASRVSVMDRITACGIEAEELCLQMLQWLESCYVVPFVPSVSRSEANGQAVATAPTCAGFTLHLSESKDGITDNYCILDSGNWNLFSGEDPAHYSPVQNAILHTPATEATAGLVAGRVLRSFSPCMYCACL